ncbi:hypothetical protein N510_002720 [Firmicutes bacterium ASF500]|nr:hypothetical protein N510_002720 [Firmicutes bacterium ASF500]
MKEKLNRVFDQVKPSPEGRERMLDRLLQTERKDRPVKKLKKLTVIGIAAALMVIVISCTAAVVTGVDQRILDFLNAQPAQEELISPYAVPVNITMKDNGGTLKIRQMLVDRYSMLLLMDFTVPDGVDVTKAEHPAQWMGAGWYVRVCDFLDSNGSEMDGAVNADWVCLERDTEQRRITFLYYEYLAESNTNEVHSIRFSASDLCAKGGVTLLSGDWSCVIPVSSNSGWETIMNEVYWTEGIEERITEIYLSPMTLHVTLERDVPLDGDIDSWSVLNSPDAINDFEWLQTQIILTDKDGEAVVYKLKRVSGNPQTQTLTVGFEEIMDPARFQGGTLTIFGHEIPLDNLVPVE